ncbi:2-isopropylmalate synthase [Ktedonosporobacter rubrisoli]|uniref:2-isopropylmalate synthase n=1 Tax=Ktedonosporobacter rubrisoli TaxID=2509675 RepID=A0A4P6K6U1_KTERU|nr:2-isopropylmalate synthase [Ktedonosporobacter rubrisoli]
MQKGPISKYRPAPRIDLPDRQWPSRIIEKAPTWCSVDLRDGNQALPIPMSVQEKLELFEILVGIGFKEIEVGFPSASQIEFEFIRRLIEEKRIPDDVTIQVIVQAREELIQRTFESIRGVKKAIIHLYNSTSPTQRRVVFGLDKADIIKIATRSTQRIKEMLPTLPDSQITFQYSPESFALTEIDFALEICEAVVDVWQPTPENKMILNLPETVQIATPNVYADQIEWFCRNMRDRESAIISVHTHNDRGTGVASTEMSLMAGAERVEGTLFGNGERTGNVDLVTVALNMYMEGVDPGLDFSNLDAVRQVYEKCTRMQVPIRQPYAGELVFTAFSGSHQDAINKGMAAQDTAPGALWDIPYLPIDPKDIGRTYEAIIRINSQSGKGGVAYVLENEYGLQVPKAMRIEFGKIINDLADACGTELPAMAIYQAFENTYLKSTQPLALESFHSEGIDGQYACIARIEQNATRHELLAQGSDPVEAFVQALNERHIANFSVVEFSEHELSRDAKKAIIAYVQLKSEAGQTSFGAAVAQNSIQARVQAVISALNRLPIHTYAAR